MNEHVKRGKDFVLDDMRDDFLARLFLLSVEELARIFLPVLLQIYGGVQHIAGAANVWYDTSIEDRCHRGW